MLLDPGLCMCGPRRGFLGLFGEVLLDVGLAEVGGGLDGFFVGALGGV